MTNNHVLDSNFINNYDVIEINYKNQEKKISLKHKRIKIQMNI